ncbi:MAG: hypothetical protein BGO52_03770 [Sphingobacteriales bacterium 44-61]|nr:MAG: hypothetical protein BGO52_03770 [Sphingobacteriales bacterium 44-61]
MTASERGAKRGPVSLPSATKHPGRVLALALARTGCLLPSPAFFVFFGGNQHSFPGWFAVSAGKFILGTCNSLKPLNPGLNYLELMNKLFDRPWK